MRNLILALALIIALVGCNNNEPININIGGDGHSNDFSHIKKFPNTLYSNYKIANELGGSGSPLLELNSGLVMFAGKNGTIACLAADKTQWKFQLDSNSYIYSAMVADTKDNIYFVDYYGKLCKLTNEGKLAFAFDTKQISSTINIEGNQSPLYNDLLIVQDGIIVAGSLVRSGFIAKVSFDGKLLWQYVSTLGLNSTPTADSIGNIYCNGNSWQDLGTDSLFSLSNDGKLNWSKPFVKQSLIKYPVVANNRLNVATTLFLGDNKVSKLYSYKLDGTPIYEKELSFIVRNLSLSNEHNLFVVCYNAGLGGSKSGVFSFKPNGDKDWQIFIDYSIPTPCLITKDEIAVAGTNKSSMGIFYIDRATGKLRMVQDIGRADELSYKPFVTKAGNILLPSLESSSYIKVDFTLMDKLYNFD